jgi:hypothetical protein
MDECALYGRFIKDVRKLDLCSKVCIKAFAVDGTAEYCEHFIRGEIGPDKDLLVAEYFKFKHGESNYKSVGDLCSAFKVSRDILYNRIRKNP